MIVSTEIHRFNFLEKNIKRRKLISRKVKNTQSSTLKYSNVVPPFNKPLGNFFIGIGEDLLFGNKDYLKCFPPEWINKSASSEQMDKGNREKILNFFHYFYLMNLFTKRRLSSENSENNSAVKNLESSATKGIFSNIIGTLNVKIKNSKETYKNKFLIFRDKIKNNLNKWEKKIAEIDGGEAFLKIAKKSWSTLKKLGENILEIFLHLFSGGKFLECLDAIKFSFPSLKNIVTGVISKVTSLETAIGLQAPGIAIWAVDMVIALICEFREFKIVLEYIESAKDSDEKNVKFYYSGKIIGKLLNVFSTSKTFFSTIIGIIIPFS